MTVRHIAVAAALALFAADLGAQAPPAAATDTAASRAEVMAVITKLFDGMRKHDTASMRALFHPSASLLSSSVRQGNPVVSANAISGWLNSIAQAPDTVVLDERLMNTVIHVKDGLASV